MKPQFGDNAYAEERSTRAMKIRSIFTSGTTIAAHTERCIDAGLWSDFEIRAKATKACRDEVRDALGEIRNDGLPFAGPTGARQDGAPVWRQMEFWSYDDYVYNYNEYKSRGGSNIQVANRIAEHCRGRYSRGPKNLRIIEEDEPEV